MYRSGTKKRERRLPFGHLRIVAVECVLAFVGFLLLPNERKPFAARCQQLWAPMLVVHLLDRPIGLPGATEFVSVRWARNENGTETIPDFCVFIFTGNPNG